MTVPRSDHTTHKRRYLEVAESLLASIASGSLKAGDRLPPDRDIGVAHNVSRATAREALLALELMGAVRIRPGRGVYVSFGEQHVSSMDATSMPFELVEARRHFEPAATMMAVTRISDSTISLLKSQLEEAAALVTEDAEIERFMALNLNLHIELAGGCGNSVMATIVTDLVNVDAHPLWRLINRQVNNTVRERTIQLEDHGRILAAVADREPQRAYQEMAAHLDSVRAVLFGQRSASTMEAKQVPTSG